MPARHLMGFISAVSCLAAFGCAALGTARLESNPLQALPQTTRAERGRDAPAPDGGRGPARTSSHAGSSSANHPAPLADAGSHAATSAWVSYLDPPYPAPLPNAVRQAAAAPAAALPAVELDLTEALARAGGRSPQIAFAAARYREAYARLESARTLWLPSIRAGVSFNHHDGTIQETSGRVFDVSRSSLQSGLGGRAVGAGTPAVPGVVAEFHTTDAVFGPKIAAHAASATSAAARASTNDTLLETALAYLDLLRAVQGLRIAEETRNNAKQLANLTAAFANSGQGPQADADRAQTELALRRNDVSRAQEAVAVASARLAEQLSLDPSVRLTPREPGIVPIELVSPDLPLSELLASGLTNRPELAEAEHLVCEAVYRYRREKYAPLVPSVLLGISESGFGGGFGGAVDNFRDRFDFDAAAYWEIRNFGLGERAKRDETRARYDQARMLQVQTMDRVAREIVEARAQVRARKGQIQLARSGIQAASDSYRRNLQRIREGQGLPIEVLQSLQALDGARREHLRTVADYNEAQFRLERALGWPIQ